VLACHAVIRARFPGDYLRVAVRRRAGHRPAGGASPLLPGTAKWPPAARPARRPPQVKVLPAEHGRPGTCLRPLAARAAGNRPGRWRAGR